MLMNASAFRQAVAQLRTLLTPAQRAAVVDFGYSQTFDALDAEDVAGRIDALYERMGAGEDEAPRSLPPDAANLITHIRACGWRPLAIATELEHPGAWVGPKPTWSMDKWRNKPHGWTYYCAYDANAPAKPRIWWQEWAKAKAGRRRTIVLSSPQTGS